MIIGRDIVAKQNLLQWENKIALSSDWTATAGVDLGSENGHIVNRNLNSPYGSFDMDVNRDKYSAYAGLLGNIGQHSLQANVR